MNRRKSSRWCRGILVVASCALLALTAGAAAASAGTEGPTAAAAKKKCKKAKKSAVAAKKKCKPKKKSGGTTTTGPVVTLPGTTIDTTPTSPATLTWDNSDADLNLYVWENGSFGGLFGTGIPSSTPAVDDDSLGPETFTASPNTRRFTYGICAADVPEDEDTNFTLIVQDQTGVSHVFNSDSFSPPGPIGDNGAEFEAIFGGFNPAAGWCADSDD